jgi:hypothetical protein
MPLREGDQSADWWPGFCEMLRQSLSQLFESVDVSMIEWIDSRGITSQHTMELSIRSNDHGSAYGAFGLWLD